MGVIQIMKIDKRHIVACVCLILFMILAIGSADNNSSSKQTSSTPSSTPSSQAKVPDLEVVEHSPVSEEYARYIVGTVKNNTNKKYEYVQVSINLYDKTGAQVGSTMANVNNLEPHGTWKFKAIVLEDNTAKYKIDKVTGF